MLLIARRLKEENKYGGTRYILNNDEVAEALQNFTALHKIEFEQTYMEDHTPAKQIELVAGADIFVAMHGSVLSLAGFQPPRSMTIEVLPTQFNYCIFHHCLSHSDRIWVQSTKRGKDLDSEEKDHVEELVHEQGKHQRDVPRKFKPSNILTLLDEAFDREGSYLLTGSMYLGDPIHGDAAVPKLGDWFAADTPPAEGQRKWLFKHEEMLCGKRYNKFGDVMQVADYPLLAPEEDAEVHTEL